MFTEIVPEKQEFELGKKIKIKWDNRLMGVGIIVDKVAFQLKQLPKITLCLNYGCTAEESKAYLNEKYSQPEFQLGIERLELLLIKYTQRNFQSSFEGKTEQQKLF
jgi:hypothetical protein